MEQFVECDSSDISLPVSAMSNITPDDEIPTTPPQQESLDFPELELENTDSQSDAEFYINLDSDVELPRSSSPPCKKRRCKSTNNVTNSVLEKESDSKKLETSKSFVEKVFSLISCISLILTIVLLFILFYF